MKYITTVTQDREIVLPKEFLTLYAAIAGQKLFMDVDEKKRRINLRLAPTSGVVAYLEVTNDFVQ